MEEKPKIIVIVGQTSTGKSDFAVEVARKINGLNHSKRMVGRTSQREVLGEVISADSRQVYKGMDLGTGKITKREMKGVSHHLLDVVSPKKVFTVSDYKKLADKKIKEIIARGHVPIICGGTGFYIDAVVNGIILPEIPPNAALRKELSKKSSEELYKILLKLDQVRAKNIDKNNPVRLIRAIEIAKTIGKVPPTTQDNPVWLTYKIGLKLPDKILRERINARLDKRIKKGMLKEIQDLHTNGLSWKRMHELGLEYRYGALYLQGKITKKEMIEKLQIESWHYAKRQKTWFKRDKEIMWIDPRKNNDKIKIENKVQKFLNRSRE